jgi:predicted RNA-binding Zn-ribbon protein involved in translation (DUF1610 family)
VITLSMACGHVVQIGDNDGPSPCPTCGERRVQAVKARAPKFRGVCQGPHAKYESLSATPVTVGVHDGE